MRHDTPKCAANPAHPVPTLVCPTHKVLLRPSRQGMTCPKCNYNEPPTPGELVIRGPEKRRIDKSHDIGLIDDPKKMKLQIWPIDDQVWCGKCSNKGAYYYLRQTRKADEPTTAFYECTRCGNKWKRAR